MMSLAIAAFGTGLIIAGLLTLRRQSRAGSCPRHSRSVGRIAVMLAYVWAVTSFNLMKLVRALRTLRAQLADWRRRRESAQFGQPARTWNFIPSPAGVAVCFVP